MSMRRFLVYASTPILVLLAACGGGSNNMTSGTTQADLAAAPNPAMAGVPVVFTLNAYNDHLAIKEVSIDYTNDGTWDDTRTVDRSAVTASFGFTYGTAGNYSVRFEVKDADGTATTKTLPLVVAPAHSVTVSYQMLAGGTDGGQCGAIGQPAGQCTNCPVLLSDGQPFTGELGEFPDGAPVRMSQNFSQEPYVNGRITYSCNFTMVLVAKAGGADPIPFAGGSCQTNSRNGGHLTCNIDVNAFAP